MTQGRKCDGSPKKGTLHCPVCRHIWEPKEFKFLWDIGWVITKFGGAQLSPAESDIMSLLLKFPDGISVAALVTKQRGSWISDDDLSNNLTGSTRLLLHKMNKKLNSIGVVIKNIGSGIYIVIIPSTFEEERRAAHRERSARWRKNQTEEQKEKKRRRTEKWMDNLNEEQRQERRIREMVTKKKRQERLHNTKKGTVA